MEDILNVRITHCALFQTTVQRIPILGMLFNHASYTNQVPNSVNAT
jgi:hypothetical protein